MASEKIGPGTKVTLRFSLLLESGQTVDSTGERAAEFTVGDGNLLPGFEQALFGLQAGARERLYIEAARGFGEPKPDNVQQLRRDQFPADMELTEGLVVSFGDQQHGELPGVIRRVNGDRVEVDFNHPLAGKNLYFEVDIVDVERVSDEIIRVRT